jgi:hypothetical protein
MKRWGGIGTWIETGTYRGDTSLYLSNFAKQIYTLEPSEKLYNLAQSRFLKTLNVSVIHDTSENGLAPLLKILTMEEKADLTFWLD